MDHLADSDKHWETIYLRYGPVLYNYGYKITPQQALIEDCIQDIFTVLWEKKHHLQQIQHIKAYLIKCFRRKIMEKLRQHQLQQNFSGTEEAIDFELSFSLEDIWIAAETKEARRSVLQQALQTLTARQREAVFLKFYENHSYDEVADIMQLEKSALYSMIYKAMSQLRNSLKNNQPITAILFPHS